LHFPRPKHSLQVVLTLTYVPLLQVATGVPAYPERQAPVHRELWVTPLVMQVALQAPPLSMGSSGAPAHLVSAAAQHGMASWLRGGCMLHED
jgi:hypothetical protein